MKCNLLVLIISALLISACASAVQRNESIMPAIGGGAPEEYGAGAPASEPAPPVTAGSREGVTSNTATDQDRLVIQNVDLTIVVKDPQARMLEIGALARRLGGYVVSSNLSQTTIGSNAKVPEGSISIRVPVGDLDNALNEIKTNVVEVLNENRSGQDVTDQYVDLQSQLRAKQAAADKLFEILEKTEKADDTLLVFNQLTQVQSEIEVLKGQINYYEQSASLSAISVRILAEATIQPIEIAGWKPQGVARDAIQALVNFFQNFASFLIWLAIFVLPVAAVVLVLLALLWRLLRWFWVKVFPRKTPPSLPAEKE